MSAAAAACAPASSICGVTLATGSEPDLGGVCSSEADQVSVRNVLYTLWAMNRNGNGGGDSSSCYLGYRVQRIPSKGYLVLAFFGPGYRVSLQEMQLLMDASPLRIDSLFVRGPQEDDFLPQDAPGTDDAVARKKTAQQAQPLRVSAVLSICILDSMQPVRITEAEVVRVRKRSRGLILSTLFGK